MKTILYNPIFINPQAYYVFPRLTRYLQPDNKSTAEPANYIGTIEVKVIAYGDTTLKRTYTNTDSIDLSEFKNTWIRISLFTKVGSCVLGEWKIGNMESDLPYIDPEVLASLKAVVIVGNKTNNDSDRAIVKNLVDPDNPFVISNAAYTEGSGYADKGSPYYGAFVTDGVEDLITSTKTVQEMGITDEVTVVSMIHQIDKPSNFITTNNIRTYGSVVGRNAISLTDKTGIYGWYKDNIQGSTINVINNILGDKADYTASASSNTNLSSKFSVVGYIINDSIVETSQVAWYWTIIANKVLTTDQINQVIAYYNLDRTLKPDILCNTIKQGITNENHAEFGDKLIDFSGNGRDIQLNNIAWDGDSGIGKYNYPNWKVTATIANTYSTIVNYPTVNGTYSINVNGVSELMQSIGLHLEIKYTTSTGIIYNDIKQDGVYSYILPDGATDLTLRFGGIPGIVNEPCNITITQIPSHAGGLCLDGVNDFGKVTGMPVYKDYTFIIDRQIISIGDTAGIVASKSEDSTDVNKQGAFLFEYLGAPNNISAWSFYKDNGKVANTDFTRGISYQSTYSYNGKDLTVGTSKDSDKLWLGTIRDRDSRFFNGAIYSLMSFPYSMSEFLIERQLRKHKLGTLYPDMVEFRPVINSNVLLDAKPTFVIRGTNTYLNAGDYVPENSQIWVSIKMNNAADRITKFTVNGKTIDIPENAYSEVTLQYGFPFVIDKSPQKIGITIEQDENYVLFNPVINSTYDNYKLTFHFREYEELINIGDYIPKGTYIKAKLDLKNNIDELVTFTFNGVNIDYAKSPVLDTAYNIRQIYNYDSPQEVNITIDEYIRYEDIKQPYPVLLRFNDENGNEVSWGGKFRVGSTITRIGSIADPESNLLNGLYSISGLSLNGKAVTSNTSIVEKQMVFRTTATYLLDDNEPKCILSPSRLRMPNSSYKLLGYIPDISGHGNHGKINNSAYASMSGANGYLLDFKTFTTGNSSLVNIKDDSRIEVININKEKSTTWVNLNKSTSISLSSWKIKVTGMKSGDTLGYYYSESTDATLRSRFEIKSDGIYSLPSSIANSNNIGGIAFDVVAGADSAYRIEQIGKYEGAYCLDGVDDFVTIPTVTGGKQVLMKVNWLSDVGAVTLYDQRLNLSDYEFAIYNGTRDLDDNPVMAYQGRNNGQTYIDGILNSNIMASELKAITHNITITNELSLGINNTYPVIGSTRSNTHFAQMSLYDFMLFDEISTDDKIKELNEYVGIEAKVELPPYYWDTYGKTNSDADRDTIQQRGVAVGDYDLTNYNHAYEGMSGYNGYPIILSGTNRTYQDKASYINVVGDDKNVINLTRISFNTASIFSYVKQNGVLTSYNKDIESFKIKVTGIDYSRFIIKYSYISKANATDKTNMIIASDGIYELPKSFASDGSLTSSNVWIGINFIKQSNDIPDIIEDVNVTIEVLPEYENGLAYDGVEDFSDNKNIPLIDDFTVIAKRTWLEVNTSDKPFIIKGDTLYPDGNKNAFLFEYGKLSTYSFGQNNKYDESVVPSLISWAIPTSYNGTTSLVRGGAIDTVGIDIAHATKIVLYKLILYPKTIPLLQINFLKNLMERDEIIDLNNPIFIQE